MKALLLSALCSVTVLFQEEMENPEGPVVRDPAWFRREVEAAYAAGNPERMESLVAKDPTQHVSLFVQYTGQWSSVRGEPDSGELRVRDLAHALGEAVDLALEAPGLLEMAESLDSWTDEDRGEWRTAQEELARGSLARSGSRWSEAAEILGRARDRFERLGWTLGVAQAEDDLGQCYGQENQDEKAISLFQHSLSIYEKFGDPRYPALALARLGLSCRAQGRIEKAIELLERSLALARASRSSGHVAHALASLGLCSGDLGDTGHALELHRRALALWEEIGESREVAASLRNIAACHSSLDQQGEAVEALRRCVVLDESLGDSRTLADDLHRLGNCAMSLGLHEEAFGQFERSLSIREESGDRAEIAASLASLGKCCLSMGQEEKARELLERALSLEQEIGNPLQIARSLSNVAATFYTRDHHDKGIELLERALAILERDGSPEEIATVLDNLGLAYHAQKDYDKAIGFHQRALALNQQLDNPRGVAFSLNNLAYCSSELGRYEEAIATHRRVLAMREAIGDPQEVAATHGNLALCHEGLGQFAEAIREYERASQLVDQFSLRTLSDDQQLAFWQKWSLLADSASRCAARVPDDRDSLGRAFRVAESLRARVLSDRLVEDPQEILRTADPELLDRRKELLDRVESLRLELATARNPSADPGGVEERGKELQAALDGLDEITRKLRRQSPALMELARPAAASLQEVQKTVLEEGSVLLSFLLLDYIPLLWIVTRDSARVVPLAADETLQELAETLADSLQPDAPRDRRFVEPARRLYDLLLGEATEVDSARELIVVADGFLARVPFEVLLTREPGEDEKEDLAKLPYLLRDKTIRYAPSASFLAFVEQQAKERTAWKKDALLLGDPVFAQEKACSSTAALRAYSALDAGAFERLRRTREEVTRIASALVEKAEAGLLLELRDLPRSGAVHGSRFDLYVGDQVTESRLQGDLTGYRILHVATHGYFDPEYPWFSGLVLSDTAGENPGDGGFLNLLELGTLKLDAQLVFLSACDTGKGRLLLSEGIQSTARSFLLAGADSVVCTLWRVDDETASTLAQVFYDKLFQGEPPARALQDAKLFLLEGGNLDRGGGLVSPGNDLQARNPHAHPSVWAPFVLWGG